MNYSFAMRFANGDFERLPSLAKELGTLKPRVIVAGGNTVGAVHRVLPDLPLYVKPTAAIHHRLR